MILYLDESGDLGFEFSDPYRRGGSSRYLTIAFLLIDRNKKHLTKRIVKKIYKHERVPSHIELKGNKVSPEGLKFFSNKVVDLLSKYQTTKISTITVKKQNVQKHIRKDHNKLYNYMIKLSLEDICPDIRLLSFIPDPRSIKVKSGDSLINYLQTVVWLELNKKTHIEEVKQESHSSLNLQFVDYIAHIIWSNYEDNNQTKGYSILRSHIIDKQLFF